MAKAKAVEATPPCPICQRPKETPCGRCDCPLRECLTVGIPDGLTESGRVDTSTKEWQE